MWLFSLDFQNSNDIKFWNEIHNFIDEILDKLFQKKEIKNLKFKMYKYLNNSLQTINLTSLQVPAALISKATVADDGEAVSGSSHSRT